MDLSRIKTILANGEVRTADINAVIDSLAVDDIKHLSESETHTLEALLNGMQRLGQDLHTADFVNDHHKAGELLAAIQTQQC